MQEYTQEETSHTPLVRQGVRVIDDKEVKHITTLMISEEGVQVTDVLPGRIVNSPITGAPKRVGWMWAGLLNDQLPVDELVRS